MQRISPTRYIVTCGEVIDIEVQSIQFSPPLVVAAQNGEDLRAPGTGNTRSFSFTATLLPPKSHFADLDLRFPPNPTPGSHYHIHVRGSLGGDFDAPDLFPEDGAAFSISFKVTA
jgi:hypothetical protein